MLAGRRRCYGTRFRPLGDDAEDASSQKRLAITLVLVLVLAQNATARVSFDSTTLQQQQAIQKGNLVGAGADAVFFCCFVLVLVLAQSATARVSFDSTTLQQQQAIQKGNLVGAGACWCWC